MEADREYFIGIWKMAKPDTWKELCAKAAVEPDPKRLLDLVTQIIQVLEQTEKEQKGEKRLKIQ